MDEQRGAVLITGALGGLGTAIVERLLADGHSVVACDRRQALVDDWLGRFARSARERLAYHHVDVTREDQVNALAERLRGDGIHIAYVVNNAGVQGAADVWAMETKVWERVIGVNLDATFYFTRAFSRPMTERGFGRIVNFASVYAYHPGKGQSPYAAAKAGIVGFTHATALELAEHGVTVNVIAPGLILHEGLRALFP
ncbi:MAG: acetoacetyl-CoA reductase, partial [Candidatus Binatota bacterium]|nr:acetoacetyl-CoA reductase [Candidatus Binatota bacterium]